MQQSGNIRMGITHAQSNSPQSDTKPSHNLNIGMGITGANITAGMMPLNRTIKQPPIMMATTMKGRRSTIAGNETVTANHSKAFNARMKQAARRNSLNFLTSNNWR
jgi:hypothetical protein